MENKKISKKIKDSLRLIKAFKNKAALISDEAGNALKEHIKNYDHAVKLRNEIAKLQASLKFKKKEIASVVKELSKNRKITKKGLKKSKKSTAPVTAFNSNEKPSPKAVIPQRRRKVDPTRKTTKTRVKPSGTRVKPLGTGVKKPSGVTPA